MDAHLYPGTIQALSRAIGETNQRQIVETIAPGAVPPADGLIRWELICRSSRKTDVQAGVVRCEQTWEAYGQACLGQWSAEAQAGLLEDCDAVWESLDSMPGATFSDGGVLCEALVEGWSIDWEELLAHVTLGFTIIIERYRNV